MIMRHWIRCTFFALVGLGTLLSATAAKAEVVSLQCGPTWMFDLDLAAGTVLYVKGAFDGRTGNPIEVTARIDSLTDQYVEWSDPFHPQTFRHRIERQTGRYFTWASDRGWSFTATCQRIAKKPVF
ncbi:MAG TPA: hypothetical protein VN668_05235 [Stellaceae bacterium]|nr:hypothetical protein [Stellaceae bacterium]